MVAQEDGEVHYASHPAPSSGISANVGVPQRIPMQPASFGSGFLVDNDRPPTTKARNMSDDFIKEIAGRVRTLETDVGVLKSDVATIKERTGHMPTTAALWRAVAISAGGVIAGMWIIVQFLAKPWAENLVRQFDH